MGFNVGSAIIGGIEGFLETGSPIGAGIGALEGGLGGSSGTGSMLPDAIAAGGDGASSIAAYAQLAEAFG